MKVLYFAWLKEKTGFSEEDLTVPQGVTTVEDLVEWMQQRGDGFATAFANPGLVRVAVNQEHVGLDFPISENDEVAFFPPVTGG